MLISYKWLAEYLDLNNIPPHELAERMSRTGIEVEEVTVPAEGLKKIVVGYVESCLPHPDSDHLSICQVDIGEETASQIVCGAPNIQANKKVIVALHGARITGNTKIKKGKIRGQVSNGMICSLQELGYPEQVITKGATEGIYFMPEEAIIGESVFPYLWMDDAIIELSITPNRADALSMRGAAYEVGAIYQQKPHFREQELKEDMTTTITDYLSIKVENKLDTPTYQMRMIKDVKIKESPLWLQRKLMNAGIRPINNVVDVTNFVLLEFGQPLHAFDYDKIGSKEIFVRRGHSGEELITLDGEKRALTDGNIVITNGKIPIALAGVMGGLNSEITEITTTVALEAATFDAISVRKTSKMFNLRSESSSRFEKGLNLATITQACDYAAAMIAELSGGQVISGRMQKGEIKLEKAIISIQLHKINRVLGTSLTIEEVTTILDALGFAYVEDQGDFSITIPPRRWDITIEADIIEEIARIYGYDKLPSTLPTGSALPGTLTEKQKLRRRLKAALEGAGMTEAISYAVTTNEKATQFILDADKKGKQIPLQSPMSEEHSTLRMNVITGLLDTIAYNIARKNTTLSLYEFGRIFAQDSSTSLPLEENYIGLAMTGVSPEQEWYGQREKVDFYQLKGVVETIFQLTGLQTKIKFKPTTEYPDLHPGRTAEIYVEDNLVGFIGQVHPVTAKYFAIPETYVATLNYDKIFHYRENTIHYQPVGKYPAVKRDIALLVSSQVSNQKLVKTIKNNSGKYLTDIHLFDLYEGENIQKDQKSLAYTLTFSNPEATLTDEEINKYLSKITEALQANNQAVVR